MLTNSDKGNVFWVTGLAGAGKTTFGKKIHDHLNNASRPCMFLDGDQMRPVLAEDLGYDKESRLKAATRYSKLCKLISDQGFDVVCCTISMFDQIRDLNSNSIENYHEIYIKVPFEVLEKRNQKGLYSDSKQTVGKEIDFEEPKNPNLIIENNETESIENLLEKITQYIQKI